VIIRILMYEPDHYEIVGYTVKNFQYRTPIIRIDGNGETQIEYDKDSIRVDSCKSTVLKTLS
jgi:hypothetical protein